MVSTWKTWFCSTYSTDGSAARRLACFSDAVAAKPLNPPSYVRSIFASNFDASESTDAVEKSFSFTM